MQDSCKFWQWLMLTNLHLCGLKFLGGNPKSDSGAANILKVVIPSTTRDTLSETDAHCGLIYTL